MILLIDNYDSFTYNLYQQIGNLRSDIKVIRNDELSLQEIEELNPEAIVLSPGPGRPEDAGICIELVQKFYQHIPILGICLGHQVIAAALGGKVVQAKKIMHGKTSVLKHSRSGIFEHVPENVEVMRYHSLAVEKGSLPNVFMIDAVSKEEEEIMAIRHVEYPLYGLQFHPESIGTAQGKDVMRNFLTRVTQRSMKGASL
ncbi:anthranilate synthase component II [Peribacillus tepidiphilus]|uniref:anthranilate synthase component II n=1 Tax=Peribacillus tepidiphilus TaxID=2652445 RepID=UPI00129201C1|nr:aminodeoxychorismate/anthranilate synthase component II [Peribacillus tepidiphilus]